MGRVSRRSAKTGSTKAGSTKAGSTKTGPAGTDIAIVAVGRLRAGPVRSLVDEYLQRVAWRIGEHEVELATPAAGAERARQEAALLMAAVPRDSALIALDPAGLNLTSEAFAGRLQGFRDAGRTVTFAIGGAEGLDSAVTGAAEARFAFGPMTWPHALVRVMLAEQLWRAYAIVTGHPYHRRDRTPAADRSSGQR